MPYSKPDIHYVGKGVMSTIYGWGLYASDDIGLAEEYADSHIGEEGATPTIHEQTWWTNREPGDESHLLEWTKPISEENKARLLKAIQGVRRGSRRLSNKRLDAILGQGWEEDIGISGEEAYKTFCRILRERYRTEGSRDEEYLIGQIAAILLHANGIDGIKYPVSYNRGIDSYAWGANYVAFSDEHLRVDHQWQWDGYRYEQKFSMPNLRQSFAESAEGKQMIAAVVNELITRTVVRERDDEKPSDGEAYIREVLDKYASDGEHSFAHMNDVNCKSAS